MSVDNDEALRLDTSALATLPSTVSRPAYDRERTQIGVVHLGPGAFHRAHQAVYFDSLLARDPGWAISAVSIHSRAIVDALRPQQGLYTLTLLRERSDYRVIGAIRELLCARDEWATVLARMADPGVRLVTLTVTEKGYCLAGDNLDFGNPEIIHDLAHPERPAGAIGCLVAGLRQRHRQGRPPFSVLSCDNLPDNGRILARVVVQFAARIDPPLARWIETEVAFPSSMVDSITPATDDALRLRVAHAIGCHDAWPVQREPYTQWVVEDRFCNGRPALESAGVTWSDDIAGFARAKLRLLNGPHTTLAYLGSLLHIETVAEAMRDPLLAGFVERLMRESIVPGLVTPHGFDADAYVDAILDRFRNPAIRHRLSQIAWDGSQKIPLRLLGTISDALEAGRPLDTLCLPVAAWMHFVRRRAHDGVEIVDPLNARLSGIGRSMTGDAQTDVAQFLALDEVFGALAGDRRIIKALCTAYATLDNATPSAVWRALAASAPA